MFKRSLSEEFLATARQVMEKQRAMRQQTYSLYCPKCHKYTFHQLEPHGDWEHYYCLTPNCGNRLDYRVR